MNTPTVRTILCGTDFSENAAQAARAAAALARRLEKPLVLLHVADEFNASGGAPEKLEPLLQSRRERLQKETEQLATSGAVVTGEVLHGQVAEQAILTYAAEHAVDLIVVSAVSKTAFDRWTLGSVSEQVAESAAAVTLIVRAAIPFEGWARGDRALKVFVAADFSASSDAALRWVGELRKLGRCEVTVGHVDWPPAERLRLGGEGPLDLSKNQQEVQRVLERDLREKVVATLGNDPAEIWVRAGWGRVDAQLVELAGEAGADLLVVGTHQHQGLARWQHGSVSRGVLRHAPMSVACVPAAALPKRAPNVRPCRRVLVAADLSAEGGLALPYAYSVVHDGGTVTVVHVRKPSQPADSAAGSADLGGQIRSLLPSDADSRGVQTEIKILEDNDVARAICRAAESTNSDLVCVGAHAHPGAAARVMGSAALAVLQQCRRPVLVVWPPIP